MARVETNTSVDAFYGAFFRYSRAYNLSERIQEAMRLPYPVDNVKDVLTLIDLELTDGSLCAYKDINVLDQEIKPFVKNCRHPYFKGDFYLSFYLSSGNAAIYIFRRNGKLETELRLLKDKRGYDFSHVEKRFGIKQSDSRKNINSCSLTNALFPTNRKCYPGEFLYFLSDFDEIMTGERLESYSFAAIEELTSALGRFMQDANLGQETQFTFKLSNDVSAFICANNASQIQIGFEPSSPDLMEKLTRQFR
jgi:hypothetical protein